MMRDLLFKWQTIIAGGLAIVAAIIGAVAAYHVGNIQVADAQRRDEREIDALRKSLATELRQLIPQALAAHNLLKRLATTATPDSPITARMVENSSRVPAAVVYPGSAPKMGLLGGSDAMDIVTVYNLIEIARTGTENVCEAGDRIILNRELLQLSQTPS